MLARSWIPLVTALAGMMFIAGCSKVDSANLKTSGMYAKLSAVDNGSGVATLATLSTSSFSTDTIALSSGDTLTASFSGQSKTMTGHLSALGEHDYTANFGTTGPTQTVNIAFYRNNDVSAPNSSVVLPAGFTITGPTGGTAYLVSNNDVINLTWSPNSSGNNISLTFSGTCTTTTSSTLTFSRAATIGDSGTYSTTVNNLLSWIYSTTTMPSAPQCSTVTATLERKHVGTVDSHFGQGGYFTGSETRSISFSISP